uniref:NADH-ubiquinone oxidoreductase chain 2 n=1 Tax=Coprinellus micaceus TaxID=71717 RepID=A0A7T8ZT97_COPMI|nr:NADH dehydrogenase subunit 2 [Coprinellus micaceus]QQQ89372.1 NADH dehydrogenase subunit 2 [Coprinellus micaceus]
MLFSSILILIVAKALPLIRISNIHFTRISAIILLLSGILSFNILYIQSIGSGIGIYSGLFQITNISQTIEIFLLIIGSIILIGWPIINDINLPSLPLASGLADASPATNNSNKNLIANSLAATSPNDLQLLSNQGCGTAVAIDYSIIVLFSTLGSSLLVSSFDLISIYLSIELQSFGLYILSTLYRNSENSTNAGLKYFLLGGFSSCIILLGFGIIYSYTGTTQLESIYLLLSAVASPALADLLTPAIDIDYIIQGTLLGIVLVIIGLLFKIAAAPLHNWSPDVYDETPTIVTIWLTIMPKIPILILLLEIYTLVSIACLWQVDCFSTSISSIFTIPQPLFAYFSCFSSNLVAPASAIVTSSIIIKNILLISSILSLIIGTVVGLAQIKIKRLLAYSTISHIGFMLLAIAINTEQSIDSFLFYLIQYIITNLNIFFILLAISYSVASARRTQAINLKNLELIDIKYIKDLQGLFTMNPLLSLTFSISLFSMAGIPPLIGFFSKQFVLYSAIDQGYYLLSIIAIIVSVISASYYLKIIKIIHLPVDNTSSPKDTHMQYLPLASDANKNKMITCVSKPTTTISSFHSFIISSLSLFILLFIFKPTLILSSTQVLSLTLFNL